jgi:mono/diheme cytochrome c family protein
MTPMPSFSTKHPARTAAALSGFLTMALGLTACSNFPSREPPVWVWWDMKQQEKYKPQMRSEFFSDGRASRRPVPGTVPQENWQPDTAYSTGINPDNTYVARNPEPITRELIARGQTKFTIYCTPCHDRTGSGRGVVPSKAIWVPANFHDDRIVNFVDGEIFHVMTTGRRSMPSYRFQINEHDRWAIVSYVRSLQRAWLGTMNDVPADLQSKVK